MSHKEWRDFQQDDSDCREAVCCAIARVKVNNKNISIFPDKLNMLWDIFELLAIRDSLLYRQWHLPCTYLSATWKHTEPLPEEEDVGDDNIGYASENPQQRGLLMKDALTKEHEIWEMPDVLRCIHLM